MARHLLAWLAVIGVSGCSLALDGPKPNRPKNYAPKCDDSKGLVVADGLFATAIGIGALSAFGENEPEAGVVLGLIGVAFTASAIRGNGVVNECRAEQALFAQEGGRIFDPEAEQAPNPYRPRPGYGPPAAPAPARPPVATAPTAPSDPYGEPPAPVVTPAPVRPPTPAPVPAATKPAPRPVAEPAAIDPDAWRDFWSEVP